MVNRPLAFIIVLVLLVLISLATLACNDTTKAHTGHIRMKTSALIISVLTFTIHLGKLCFYTTAV